VTTNNNGGNSSGVSGNNNSNSGNSQANNNSTGGSQNSQVITNNNGGNGSSVSGNNNSNPSNSLANNNNNGSNQNSQVTTNNNGGNSSGVSGNNNSNSGDSQANNNSNGGSQNSQTAASNNGGKGSGVNGNNNSGSDNSAANNNGGSQNQQIASNNNSSTTGNDNSGSNSANQNPRTNSAVNNNSGTNSSTGGIGSGDNSQSGARNNSGSKSAHGSKTKSAGNNGNANKTISSSTNNSKNSGTNKTQQTNSNQASGINNNSANNPPGANLSAANTAANSQGNNTIGNPHSSLARNDSDSTVVVSDTSLKVKQAKLPATFGYKKLTTTHDALLDSLANAVPKPKVSDSRSAKRLKIQEANTITNIQFTDTNAATLNQKSQNYFLAASSLVENAEKTRGKAQTESDKHKSEALYHRADSLDDLIFQLNLKGDEALAEANYRQYYTNANQIASISIHPSKKLAYKVTAAKRMIHDADNSYRRSMSEKDRANVSRILATKHTYIKSARQDLAIAILRQQSAVYLYFQVDSDQTASTIGRTTSDSSLHFSYSGFMKVKTKEGNNTNRSNSNVTENAVTHEDNSNNAAPNNNPPVIAKTANNPSPIAKETNPVKENVKQQSVNPPDTSSNILVTSKKRTNKKTTHLKEGNNNTAIAKANPNVNADVSRPAENNTTHTNPVVENHTNPIIPEPGDIFKQLKRSPYSASNPIPIDPSLPMGLIFKVQIGAFKNPIKQNLFKGFEPIIGLTAPQGYIRYSAGLFKTLDPARIALAKIKELGYPDAFIIAFYDGRRISIQEAMEKLGMPVPPIATNPANYQANIDSIAFARIQAEAAAKDKQDSSQTGRHNRKKKKGNDVNSTANNVANENKQPGANVASSGDNKVVVIGKNTIKPTKKSIIDERKKSIKDTVPPKSKPIRNVKGLVYTVQVGSFPKHKDFVRLSKMKKLYSSTDENGVIKYSCGTYSSLADARAAKDIILANTSVRDAFISAYYNGKKISLTKAADLLSKGVETGPSQPVDFSTNNTTSSTPPANNQGSAPAMPISQPAVVKAAAENTKSATENVVNNSFEDASKDHVIYTIQLGSYSGEVPVAMTNKILAHANEGIEPHQEKHGFVTYYAGKFTAIDSANALQQKLAGEGFQQAFIVAYYHGKKISLQEAQSINNKE
ncbi:MAG TPA: hypothetical protein VK809_13350, partial [Bacteroidia bacterium]|nr:hypothetical protein [Bacteroidia bacterium]